jgi:hypothetical protein
MQENKIDKSERVCFNCKHLAWLIALGQGLRCVLPQENGKRKYEMIPRKTHTCEFFEPKDNENKR